jgi:low affinity Fe/Cu permease
MKTRTEKTERARKRSDELERIALAAPGYIGSVPSLTLHTIGFVGIFALQWFGFSFDQILLILTTVVSLEAIYLAIFIQMTVNRQAAQIEEVSEDVEEISKDIDTIQEDVKEIGEEVEDISEDVEELGEEIEKDDKEDAVERSQDMKRIERLETVLEELLAEVRGMKK